MLKPEKLKSPVAYQPSSLDADNLCNLAKQLSAFRCSNLLTFIAYTLKLLKRHEYAAENGQQSQGLILLLVEPLLVYPKLT
ncbi:hypothetical protein Syn6312_1928 [Synechococcus sp. PCC 6312]|nr:hypothetical protein Syn6312_1928 [Synechococcus sp. PCC 6312]